MKKDCTSCFYRQQTIKQEPCNTCSMDLGFQNYVHKDVYLEAPEQAKKGAPEAPLATQVGGAHYKALKIQPIEYIHANNLSYCEANIVKYITRWRDKGGKQDLEKVIHYVQLLMQLEGL